MVYVALQVLLCPSLDLFVSYRKNTESVGVKRFIDQLNKVFHLDKNLD
ncbi:hypothetical protein ACIN3137_A3187 [Acinetobacter baumannii OIFC137]|nr:hypothetical protein ACIN3137_A3187 [Acinetobacter baumannii OIFC137]EJG24636.1 hypothetical protein ACIN5109_1682 [Acinetobacter baumannii OIFC109]EJO41373.1 hypothetical protein ACINIS123_0678 [Acinetobacter baumannii IS-123]EJP58515.1 hypothetical protein ACINNAV81_3250 [Acinetobacter baumannii Naval-81]EKL50546.1 hypothetical protein ACINNAV13_0588 [Acinetobacter baumannii Naval-13]EKP59027.1 hypothetical protein ACINWCA694_0464 [Acinetobacter baumannii WC-A-694]